MASAGSKFHTAKKEGWWDVKVEQPEFTGRSKVQRAANAVCASAAKMSFNHFLSEAKKDAPSMQGRDHFGGYFMDSRFRTTTNSSELVSGHWTTYTYTGGAHGMTNFRTVNIGWHWGEVKELDIQDLFLPGVDGMREARFVVLQKLRAEERADWVQDGDFMLADEILENFVISTKGITWLIEPYAVGSYASGSFEITIPFNDIFGLDRDGALKSVMR